MTSITPRALLDLIGQGRAPAILDVRSRAEYLRGHVPGAVHIPFQQVIAGAAPAVTSRDQPLVIYCGHGPRAWMAGRALRGRGFRDIRYLKGHWAGWKREDLPRHSNTGN